MKFNFDHISFSEVQGYSLLKTKKSSISADATKTKNLVRTEILLQTLLNAPKDGLLKKDSILDFYAAISRNCNDLRPHILTDRFTKIFEERTLAINKNTADRHGRT